MHGGINLHSLGGSDQFILSLITSLVNYDKIFCGATILWTVLYHKISSGVQASLIYNDKTDGTEGCLQMHQKKLRENIKVNWLGSKKTKL